MSLYRPIPPLHLAANLDQPLSPLNLRDYVKLLYWIFFFPQAIRDYIRPQANVVTPQPTANNLADTEADPKAAENALRVEAEQREATLVRMSVVLLLVLTLLSAVIIFVSQTRLVDLRSSAALKGGLGAVPLGLLLAGLVFGLNKWQKQPAKGLVLGVATGITTTVITMFGLGEFLDDHFLGMGRALGYGFISGSGVGIISNLATTLSGKAKASAWRSGIGAGVSALLIFLINGANYTDTFFNLDLGQENLLAVFSGALAFFGGAQVGQRRPLDWMLGKLRLHWQVGKLTKDPQLGKFTRKTNPFTYYAPGLEALFAHVAPAQLASQPDLPHVTLIPITQFRHHLETWLDHEWERGLTNSDQLWRYTNQQTVVIGAVQQVLQEKSGEDQVTAVAQFVNKVSDIAWPMLLYPLQPDSITVEKLEAAKQPAAPANQVVATTIRTQARRYEYQRWQLQQEVANMPPFTHLPLDTPAQKTVAGFWYLYHKLIDESILAFQGLPATALTKELQAIAATIEKLLHAKNLLLEPKIDLPERPKEPKRKATWDAFDKFKLVIRYGRLYHQCQDADKRQTAYDMATYQLDEVTKDESKIPSAERPMIKALMDLWRKELLSWQQDTRTWQRMKPSNPFIFLEPLRNRPPFVGRESELSVLKQAGSRGSLQPVLLSGLVHSGKSSLVHKAMVEYKDEICIVLFNIPDPGNGLLLSKAVHWALYQNLKRRLQEKITDKEEAKFQANPAATTEELIREFCRRYKTPLVLAVGNVEQLYPAPTRPTYANDQAVANGLFAFWWRLMQNIGSVSFVFISQRNDLPNTPFNTGLKKIQLQNLAGKEVLKLLTMPTPEFIPLFAPATIQHIYNLTNGQPYLIQLIAHCVTAEFNRALEDDQKPEPVFMPEDVDAILNADPFQQFSQIYFQTLRSQLETLKPGSNRVLRTIAAYDDGLPTDDLELVLTGQYEWSTIEDILDFLQQQEILIPEEERWYVAGELLRQVVNS